MKIRNCFCLILLLCSITFASNKYVCHPDGNDLNGGGFYNEAGSIPDWGDWHNNFDAVAVQDACIISNVTGSVRINSVGNFASTMEGAIVNCDFSAVYTDGRYVVTDANDDWIEIPVAYSSIAEVDVRVGGAIKDPNEACQLAYGTDGDELVFPANQTTQTVNEVDGSANQILCVTEGATLDMYGVDEDTGVLLDFDDTWPVIKAKSGSTWDAGSAMLYMQSGVGDDSVNTTTLKLDKLILDGNELTPYIVYLGDYSNDFVIIDSGDVKIINSKSDGTGLYSACYTRVEHLICVGFKTLYISNCGIGYDTVSRLTFSIYDYMWVNNCTTGIDNTYILPYLFGSGHKFILTNNNVGIHFQRYDNNINSRFLFCNNTTDIKIDKYSTSSSSLKIWNSVFYNDATGGKILDSDDDGTYVSVEFNNCVLGNLSSLSDTSRFSGVTPLLTNCDYISADPTVDKDNGDYRLDPDFADIDKIWDWDKQTNCIGATSPAEPSSSGTTSSGSVTVTMD